MIKILSGITSTAEKNNNEELIIETRYNGIKLIQSKQMMKRNESVYLYAAKPVMQSKKTAPNNIASSKPNNQ
jgi:hypothetical protein